MDLVPIVSTHISFTDAYKAPADFRERKFQVTWKLICTSKLNAQTGFTQAVKQK